MWFYLYIQLVIVFQTSKILIIFILDLRKKFEREPISVAAELGETAVLQCLPPEGKPLPEVKTQKPFNEIECR